MNTATSREEATVSDSTTTPPPKASAHIVRTAVAVLAATLVGAIAAPVSLADSPSPVPLPYPSTAVATGGGVDGSVGVGTAARSYTAISNVMKTKHDTVKNSISNVR